MRPARAIDRDSLKLMFERCEGGTPFKVKRYCEKIEKAYSRGQLYMPDNEKENQRWWRCEARMMLGDYSDWSGWEYRDEWAATLWHHRPYPVSPWNGLPTECLYVIGEQGVGDEVCFASVLPDCLKLAKRVIVETDPRLMPAFSRMGCETVASAIDPVTGRRYKRDLPEGVTAWMALADLPRMFRLDRSMFPGTPYLKADPAQFERFIQYRANVGISWRGAQGEEPGILAAYPDSVSLQYDQRDDENVARPAGLDLRGDVEGLLGLLANLRKVVTVSTSVAHFACALGVETHIIIADRAKAVRKNVFPFKWVCRATPGSTPWYGSASVYETMKDYARNLP